MYQQILKSRTLPIILRSPVYSNTFRMSSTNASHATGDSIGMSSSLFYPYQLFHLINYSNIILVPDKAQEKLPKGVEETVPNAVHDTGSQGRQSHATGDSVVPKKIQELAPEGLERALPDSIHDTSKLPPKV